MTFIISAVRGRLFFSQEDRHNRST
jgi:hypothetical protein